MGKKGNDRVDDFLLFGLSEADAAWDAQALFCEKAGGIVGVDVAGAEERQGAEGFPERAGLYAVGGELFQEGTGVLTETNGVEPVIGGDVWGIRGGTEDFLVA